ncbi:chloride channel protein [Williamsia sp. MIQD14]|nr:chloride channel protein [Williamsia sp. Leaf354]MCX6468979.1 chloride channel protein [Mycobacteriales bacterium]
MTDRERIPTPLLKKRLPSGRGAMLQPNATGDGEAQLTARFWALVIVTGIVTGFFGVLLMLILFTVEHAAFGVSSDGQGFSAAVAAADGWRRVTPLLIGGVIAGVGWFLLRRFTPGRKSEADEVLWTGEGRLSFRRSLGTSVLSEIVIGLGASLGREAAPKLMGAVSGSVAAEWAGMSAAQQRLLVACGGGAGLAAVYNVPLGGALFAAEVLMGAVALPLVLPALACAATATAVAWVYLPEHATYLDIPEYRFDLRLLVWAAVLGPIVGIVAAGYIRVIGWISHHQARGRWVLIAPLIAFAVLAGVAVAFPQLYGNGKGMAHDAFVGVGSIGLLVALAVLKPLVTALCLGAGASGGLFTPVMSTGAVLGAALGIAWSQVWPGSPIGAYALIGAAAMIGAGMQAPLAALVLVLELTHSGFGLMVPMMVATVIATAITRWIDGYSIYTARLSSA